MKKPSAAQKRRLAREAKNVIDNRRKYIKSLSPGTVMFRHQSGWRSTRTTQATFVMLIGWYHREKETLDLYNDDPEKMYALFLSFTDARFVWLLLSEIESGSFVTAKHSLLEHFAKPKALVDAENERTRIPSPHPDR